MASIQGGFDATVWTSATKTGVATNIGVAARVNPIVDPGNIDVPGTGRRGLYDILLGTVEPIFNLDFKPVSASFIDTYQDGQTVIPFLHLKFGTSLGITFTNVYVSTLSVEQRAGDALSATSEMWAELGEALAAASWGVPVTTPLRWLDTVLEIGGTPETEWHLWRYEVTNNLQRLPNVSTRGTREIVGKNRAVSGLIQKDLRDFDEWTALMTVASDTAKFNITIEIDGTEVLNSNCRWNRIEAPAGPEDLVLKRFPFTALDLT